MSGAEALRAAQCKLYDQSGTLPPAEIQAEVDAAKGFPLPLGVYAICTTARVSTQAQNAILLINQEHRQKGLFTVELFTWDRLDELLEEFTTMQVYRSRDATTRERTTRTHRTVKPAQPSASKVFQ
jgi:hypothetical protein